MLRCALVLNQSLIAAQLLSMRYNENVSPIEVLPGIKAVGIGIEK
ncbi:MAG: hypothetical protein ACPGO4_06740 [Flavobacteriaceae bacterium]